MEVVVSMRKNHEIGRLIGILSNQIKRQVDCTTQKNGITGVQGRILLFIIGESESRDIFQRDIEEVFNLRRSSATGILQSLEKNGLIIRENVIHDARLKKIIVTDKGNQMKEQVIKDIEELELKIMKNISEKDMEHFLVIIKKMSENLE